MADERHLGILRLGVEAWNRWYKANYRGAADLRGAGLGCLDLAGINLAEGRLEEADLRYSNLSEANLRNAHLQGAKLERANLRGACLRGATGLTRQQLHYAEGDERTELPKDLEPPDHWLQIADGWEPAANGFALT